MEGTEARDPGNRQMRDDSVLESKVVMETTIMNSKTFRGRLDGSVG